MSGFLGYNASFMLDFVVVALLIVVPALGVGIVLVKKKRFKAHSRVMIGLGSVLLGVVLFFELDMRLHGGIDGIASNAGRLANVQTPFFLVLLYVHLFFAVSCCILWGFTLRGAIKRFDLRDPSPGTYSPIHIRLARASVISIVLVAITGLMVYYFAFIN